MPDWTKTFKSEYDRARGLIARDEDFDREWRALAQKLRKLMAQTGFEAGEAAALDDLRSKATKAPSQVTITEDKGLLQAVGAWVDSDTATISEASRTRAGALKMLRHVYLLNKAGNRKVWIQSLPTDFMDWSTSYFKSEGGNAGRVKGLLRSNAEHFSEQQKRYLANSAQQGLAWCQKTGMVLANAAGTAPGRDAARDLVKRWFAEPGLADGVLDTYIATLADGFRKVIATLNKGQLVLTDYVPLRGASVQDDIDFLNSEAFTFASNGEGMDVVYIEASFFTHDAGGVVHGQKNWTRILVHELTHLSAGTDDVTNGDVRYAHYGIGPHSGFPGSDAIKNADSWAFFCADCAGILTDTERNMALRIR